MIVPSKEYFACNIPGEPSVLLIDLIDKPVAGVCHHKSDQLGAWHIEVNVCPWSKHNKEIENC